MALPLIGAVASIGSSLIGAYAASKAAKEQAAATRYAADIQRKNFEDTTRLLQPSIDAGNTARGYQLSALGLPGGQGAGAAYDAFRSSPGYDFALKTGQNQVQTSAAAGGRLFSGGALKSLARYGQGMADQQFGDWYNRLSGLSGAGQTATGHQVNAGSATANNLSDLAVQGGNNQASSYINGANALTGGIQNLSDLYAYYNPPAWARQPVAGAVQGNPAANPFGTY